MLRVTFEIIPFGDEEHPRRREIGHLNIGLQKNMDNVGQYISRMVTDGHHEPPNETICLMGHSRHEGAFELVRRCLEAHLDPDDPGATSQDDLMGALAAQNNIVRDCHLDGTGYTETAAQGGGESQIEPEHCAQAALETRGGGESQIEPEHCAQAALETPQQEDEVTIYCANCKNIDPKCVIGVEYAYNSPIHYDGISEWRCRKCGARTGRWTGRLLQDGESERPFGRA